MSHPQHRYYRIYQEIREKILKGVYRDGDKLPTEFALMRQYGVSRDTVRHAMRLLVEEELVTRIAAKGTIVKFNPAEHTLTQLRSFSEIMQMEGTPTISKNVDVRLLEQCPSEIQMALELSPLHHVYRISRIRYADDLPLSLETVYVPYRLCPELESYLRPQSSLFRLYESVYQHRLGESSISIQAELPAGDVAAMLGITATTPILKTISLGHLMDGTPLYYAISQYEGSKYIYRTTMKRYY